MGLHTAHLTLKDRSGHHQALTSFYFVLPFTKSRALSGAFEDIVTQHFYTLLGPFVKLFEVVRTGVCHLYKTTVKICFFSPIFFFFLSLFGFHYTVGPRFQIRLVETVAN